MGSDDERVTGTLPRVQAVPRGASADEVPLYLRRVYREGATGLVETVHRVPGQGGLTIGREPGPLQAGEGLTLEADGWASRRHARVTLMPPRQTPGVMVEDLGSRNGTQVDGVPVAGAVVAPPGSVIQIGGTLFVVGREELHPPPVQPPMDFACRSWSMQRLWARLVPLAQSELSVLLLGEMGTGKTRVARLIHELSARISGPFVPYNCSALPIHLEEATLFGVVANFIPQVKASEGLLTRAAQGTLFLDEVADLPTGAQAKLLDAFDTRDPGYSPVGASRRITTRCRLISATNRDVFQLAAAGTLRQDLLSRLVVGQVVVPPLRDRREDIVPLFLAALARAGVPDPMTRIPDAEAASALLLCQWVENVRGLESLAARVALGERLTPDLIHTHGHRGLPQAASSAPAPAVTARPATRLPPAYSPMPAVTTTAPRGMPARAPATPHEPLPGAQISPRGQTPGAQPAVSPQTAPDPNAAVPETWPPTPEELLNLLAGHNWAVKAAAEAVGRRRETLSRLVSAYFPGGKASAQKAWRIWRASGRVPTGSAVARVYNLLFEARVTESVQAAREAWRLEGEVPG